MSVSMADQEWAFYLTDVNDKVASIFLDLGLRDAAPDSANPHLVCCAVEMKSAREDGLSSAEEADVLGTIEDDLDEALGSLAIAVGRITTVGLRELFYYSADPEPVESAIRKTLEQKHPSYKYECDVSVDASWDFYLNVLYPSAEEMQLIQNERTVVALAEQGDLHDVPRAISHWAYFSSDEDRQSFLTEAAAAGFKVEDEFETESGALGVEVEHVERVDEIDEATLQLFRLAEAHNGDYDGWESMVVLTDALPS